MQSTKPTDRNSGTSDQQHNGFTAEGRAAMKEHADRKRTAARRGSSRAEKEAAAEQDVLAKIAELPKADRVIAERLHDIIKAAAPDLDSAMKRPCDAKNQR